MRLTATDISFSYGSNKVLSGVDVVVQSDSVAVIGPSGSGKSTLLAILGLYIAPDTGRILLDGSEPPSQRAKRDQFRSSNFQWVFQTWNVLGRRSVSDNVALPLLSRGMTRHGVSSLVEEALDAVGLAGFGTRRAYTLSGGEIQRVCIARALAAKPAFIIADEPTGQLDRETSRRVVRPLIHGRGPGTGLIVASHDMEVAARCDQVIELE